jgi:A/G-specific adenine glycosylase
MRAPNTRSRVINARQVSQLLLRWFARHKRELPWRTEPRDPYHVWLSEIMLQQTQVNTVIPYYERWLARFPTLDALAAAPLSEVLKLWEGLGYYARVRNLHRAAQIVQRDLGGLMPSTVAELQKLPGIGRYTAGAIASLAFHVDAPILDGNVVRVLSRVYAIDGNVKEKATLDRLWRMSESLLPKGRAGKFNEALMDLGSLICTPRQPDCPKCPLRYLCNAYAKNDVASYPVKLTNLIKPVRHYLTAVVVDAGGCVLIAQRPSDGLLGGLWEFPGAAVDSDEVFSGSLNLDPGKLLMHIIRERTGLRINVHDDDFIGDMKHGFSHFTMVRRVALVRTRYTQPKIRFAAGYTELRWVSQEELTALALTRSDRKIAELLLKPRPV